MSVMCRSISIELAERPEVKVGVAMRCWFCVPKSSGFFAIWSRVAFLSTNMSSAGEKLQTFSHRSLPLYIFTFQHLITVYKW